eukprot:362156-Chlamydomonas_euryale.AAC.3
MKVQEGKTQAELQLDAAKLREHSAYDLCKRAEEKHRKLEAELLKQQQQLERQHDLMKGAVEFHRQLDALVKASAPGFGIMESMAGGSARLRGMGGLGSTFNTDGNIDFGV